MKLAIHQELYINTEILLKCFKGHLLCCYYIGDVFFRQKMGFLLRH